MNLLIILACLTALAIAAMNWLVSDFKRWQRKHEQTWPCAVDPEVNRLLELDDQNN